MEEEILDSTMKEIKLMLSASVDLRLELYDRLDAWFARSALQYHNTHCKEHDRVRDVRKFLMFSKENVHSGMIDLNDTETISMLLNALVRGG